VLGGDCFGFGFLFGFLAIIGISYSVAAFPALSELYSKGDRKNFAEKIAAAGNYIIFWSLHLLYLLSLLMHLQPHHQ
jgi:O-antigen/teichoic acid export membrane protein